MHDRPTNELVTRFFLVGLDLPLNAPDSDHVQFNVRHLIKILSLVLSLTLIVGCAGDFGLSGDSGSSSATDDSADRSFHETIDRVNQQAALDAANAAAQQQFNDAMAATQQTMNNATNGQPLHDP